MAGSWFALVPVAPSLNCDQDQHTPNERILPCLQKAADVLDLSDNLRDILLTPFRVKKSKW